MKKISILIVILTTLIAFSIAWILIVITNNLTTEKAKYDNLVGNKYILSKDTVTVIDYSVLNGTVKFNNNQKVNHKLLASLKQIESGQFDKGFKAGYKRGYCQHDLGCISPIPPIPPLSTIDESDTSWQDGYDEGYKKGKKDRNKN